MDFERRRHFQTVFKPSPFDWLRASAPGPLIRSDSDLSTTVRQTGSEILIRSSPFRLKTNGAVDEEEEEEEDDVEVPEEVILNLPVSDWDPDKPHTDSSTESAEIDDGSDKMTGNRLSASP